MKRPELNRRDFNKLTVAALGGMVAGTVAGCGGGDKPEEGGEEYDVALLTEEPHVCRGLNTCKGKGASGENECAGQGTCHNANEHSCHASNECKGQGGCEDYPGQNTCKGKGACGVELSDDAWAKARPAFEGAMKDAGKEVGAAPEKG